MLKGQQITLLVQTHERHFIGLTFAFQCTMPRAQFAAFVRNVPSHTVNRFGFRHGWKESSELKNENKNQCKRKTSTLNVKKQQ